MTDNPEAMLPVTQETCEQTVNPLHRTGREAAGNSDPALTIEANWSGNVADVGTKQCSRCEQVLPLDHFSLHAGYRDGRRGQCRACRTKATAEYRARVGGEPERSRDGHLRRKYGFGQAGYMALLASQGGRCALCGSLESGSKFGFHVDHCHETGRVRGLLCQPCNQGIGRLGDNAGGLARALLYLTDRDVAAAQVILFRAVRGPAGHNVGGCVERAPRKAAA